jgi:hypothetical protein
MFDQTVSLFVSIRVNSWLLVSILQRKFPS